MDARNKYANAREIPPAYVLLNDNYFFRIQFGYRLLILFSLAGAKNIAIVMQRALRI